MRLRERNRRAPGTFSLSLALLSWSVAACGSTSPGDELLDSLLRYEDNRACTQWNLDYGPMYIVFGGELDGVLQRRDDNASALDVLEEAGLIGKPIEQVLENRMGMRRPFVTQPLTEEGKRFIETPSSPYSPATLCYATRVPVEILEYTEPTAQFGATVTQVEFRYELDSNGWAESDRFVTAFLSEKDRSRAGEAILAKTNKGWRTERVDW